VSEVPRADRETLGQAVDQKDHEDEDRGAQARAQGALDVALARLERAATRYREQGAGPGAGAHRKRAR
jgi:hypothetical protein